jgi:demethylmenaquinone methyltransferase/2-methoxy-6-polyprenyl-1,4-benzoquinol methylase
MYANTISVEAARAFYDRLGGRHDNAEWYEGQAKRRGLELLDLKPAHRVLNLGAGTGKEHRLIQAAVGPLGMAVGVDVAPVMLALAQQRTGAPLIRADARRIPLIDGVFDRIYSTYLLDLLPLADLPGVLAQIRRALRPGGRAVLVSLTEGNTLLSSAVIGLWKTLFQANPILCGGCRPLQLTPLARAAGFQVRTREVVTQAGMPSEVIALEA